MVGAVGAGKTETLNCIFGTIQRDHGEISIRQKKLPMGLTPTKAIQNGIALVPEDRNLQGMFDQSTIRENITAIHMGNISSKAGIINRKKEKELAKKTSERMLVKPNDIEYLLSNLSGGNQQKVVIGKWLIDEYSLYLLDEVAAGVDIGAKLEIYQVLRDLARKGIGILLATGDIEEAIALSHRIIIMFKGKIIKEVDPGKTSKEEILNYIMGGGENEDK